MAQIKKILPIKGCCDCPFLKLEPIYTEDSFDDFANYHCNKSGHTTGAKPNPFMDTCPLEDYKPKKEKCEHDPEHIDNQSDRIRCSKCGISMYFNHRGVALANSPAKKKKK